MHPFCGHGKYCPDIGTLYPEVPIIAAQVLRKPWDPEVPGTHTPSFTPFVSIAMSAAGYEAQSWHVSTLTCAGAGDWPVTMMAMHATDQTFSQSLLARSLSGHPRRMLPGSGWNGAIMESKAGPRVSCIASKVLMQHVFFVPWRPFQLDILSEHRMHALWLQLLPALRQQPMSLPRRRGTACSEVASG